MKQINRDAVLEIQNGKYKKLSTQNDNNISSHPSKGDDNAQGKRIIEDSCR